MCEILKIDKKYMSADEKICLTEFVERYKDILECKKTDFVSISQKKKLWDQITREFNSIATNTQRTSQQLRKAWDNIKTRRKKELAEEKKQRMATGGGVYIPPKDDKIDGVLNSVDIEIAGSIDSDTIALATVRQHEGFVLDESLVLRNHNNEQDQLQISVLENSTPIPEILPSQNDSVAGLSNIANNSEEKAHKPKKQKVSYESRGSAIEKELEVRLRRNELLQQQEAEIHELRVEEHKLRVKEQRLRVADQEMKNKITELKLKQAIKEFEN